VLLYLAGGPGQSDLGYTRAYMPTMEDHFVFAVWDQRGTGTSYDALDPTRTWTLDRAVADTIELTNYLRQRFDERKVYLFGNSWGSTLGVLAAQQHPELYHAYIGAGQMVSQRETDQIIYRDMLDYAATTGDTALSEKLRAWGEPPYRDLYAYANQIEYYDKIGPYEKTEWFTTHGPAGLDGNGAAEYGPLDKVNKLKALFDMGSVMYPQLQNLDFRREVVSLSIPVYLIQGAHELRGRLEPARQWFDSLAAPHKEWITFERSGHVPQFEEFARFQQIMTDVVVARTNR
jgi:pimeloyl-ACP methyl ester carboxylesterase